MSGITKRKMPRRLESSSHIFPNISGTVFCLFLVSVIGEAFPSLSHTQTHTCTHARAHAHTHTHTHTHICITVAILTIQGSQHKRKAISFTPGAARSGSVRLSNVTPAFQLTEVKAASLRSSDTITQYYTFPQLSHAVKTPTIRSIFTHTHGGHNVEMEKKKKKEASNRNSTNRWRLF